VRSEAAREVLALADRSVEVAARIRREGLERVIRQRTVLVLGAGASRPYGFPLGLDLVEKIDGGLRDQLYTQLAQQFDTGHIHDFGNNLRAARPYSIDAFLETRREFLDIGKVAIAHVLMRAETDSLIDRAQPAVDWYRYILQSFLLRTDPAFFQAQARQLQIITFNFDRSFERTVFNRLRAQLKVSDADARQLTTEIRVHHINGHLGEPRWLYPDSPTATEYGATDVLKGVSIAAKTIRIVHEGPESESVIEDAQAALTKAKFVYFIGFGYDNRNLKSLGTPSTIRDSVNRATAYEMTELELQPARRHFGSAPDSSPVHFYNEDALTFIRNRAEAFFD
jgi:hypothetical protein